LTDKVEFVVDDSLKGQKFFEFDVKGLEDIGDRMVLIGNYAYSDQLSDNLKKHNIKFINPFKNLNKNSLHFMEQLYNGIFDVYSIFTKIGKK